MISSGTGPEWCRSKLSVDSAGTFTMLENLCSDNSTTLSAAVNGAISSGGVVTFPALPSYRGYMSKTKDLVFMTSTNSSGTTYQFNVLNKLDSSVSFSNADLTGAWNINMLGSGDSPSQGGWAYGTININSSGVVTWNSITRSNGNASLPPSGTFTITSSGIVSDPGEASFQGFMSQDKRTIFATMTENRYELFVFQK
jgi:hypothetical protein